MNDLRIRGQDDGFSLLPIFPYVRNLLSEPPRQPVITEPGGDQDRDRDLGPLGQGELTLPPIRRPDDRDGH